MDDLTPEDLEPNPAMLFEAVVARDSVAIQRALSLGLNPYVRLHQALSEFSPAYLSADPRPHLGHSVIQYAAANGDPELLKMLNGAILTIPFMRDYLDRGMREGLMAAVEAGNVLNVAWLLDKSREFKIDAARIKHAKAILPKVAQRPAHAQVSKLLDEWLEDTRLVKLADLPETPEYTVFEDRAVGQNDLTYLVSEPYIHFELMDEPHGFRHKVDPALEERRQRAQHRAAAKTELVRKKFEGLWKHEAKAMTGLDVPLSMLEDRYIDNPDDWSPATREFLDQWAGRTNLYVPAHAMENEFYTYALFSYMDWGRRAAKLGEDLNHSEFDMQPRHTSKLSQRRTYCAWERDQVEDVPAGDEGVKAWSNTR